MPPFAEENLSEPQEKILSLLPIVPSILSVVGSVTIMRLVHQSKSQGPYKRIMFGMSLFDAFASVVFPLQAFLLPNETSTRVWAIGNEATCSAIGFVQQLSFASFFYSGMLGLYFLATIRFGIRGEFFAKYIEPWVHLLSVGYPLATAIFGSATQAYDEMDATFGCWVTGKENSVRLAWIFVGIPYFFVVISLIVNNLVIYCFVRRLLRATRALNNKRDREERIQATATQALLYVLPMAISTVWSTVLRIKAGHDLGLEDEAKVFPLLTLQAIFYPAFGFLNMAVFVRPRYVKYRLQHQAESRLQSLRHVLLLNSPPQLPSHRIPQVSRIDSADCEGGEDESAKNVDPEGKRHSKTSQSQDVSYELELDETCHGSLDDEPGSDLTDGFQESIDDLFQDLD